MGVRWATGMRWIYFHARRFGLRDVGGDGGVGGVGGTDSSSYAAMYTKERPCLCKYAKKKLALSLSLSYPVAKESGKKFGATYIICWAPKRKKEGGSANIKKRESRIV